MSETANDIAQEKLAQCADALADLERYREGTTLEKMRAEPDFYYAVCYRFVTAIEAVFDIGQIMLAKAGGRAESQRDIPALLAQHGFIDDVLASRIITMYGFRNRLVHAYGTLDDTRVAAYLSENLGDIREFLKTARAAFES